VAFAFTFVDRFCVGVIISSFVLFLALAHDLDPDARSRQLVLFLAPFAILIYPVGRLIDRFGAVAPLVGGSIGFGCLFASYGFVPTGALPIVMVASGVLSAMMFAPTLTLCTDLAPPGRRGAAYAGFNAAGSLGFIAGPLTAGAICHSLLPHWGAAAAYRTAFIVAGACQVACAVIALRWLVAMVRRGEIRSGGATPKTGRSVSHQAEIPVA
jgi:MFS family permease